MADDIDALLDEIETKYIRTSQDECKKKVKNTRKAEDDLQNAIDDLCALPEPIEADNLNKSQNSFTKKRCFPTFLAGTHHAMGHTSATFHKACDALRCLNCDFKVTWFDNFTWKSDTDYLFLRNNVPDFYRLRPKLNPRKGTRAYACQCECRSVINLTEVKSEPNLKWVCGKHL